MYAIAGLIRELPDDYEETCFKCGAIVRRRGVRSPGDLMMLSLFHLVNGCSLLEVSEVAGLTGLGALSDVAFMKRFEGCAGWFEHINGELAQGAVCDYVLPGWLSSRRVIAVDASDVVEKGRSGRTWKLHYAFDVFKMANVQHKITGQDVGETLSNFAVFPSDLFMADRAYGTLNSISHCLDGGGDFIFRIRKGCFTMRFADGEAMSLLAWLRTIAEGEAAETTVYVALDGGLRPIRVCAARKDEAGIAATRKRIRRKDSRKRKKTSQEAKEMNDYVVLVTSLGPEACAGEVLELYRLRWQVELCFKRLKSILGFGELPKRREGSVKAWLNGKLMVALLIEKMLSRVDFSPAGRIGCSQEPMA